MGSISRPTILAYVRPEATLFCKLLSAFVASLAERLQTTQPEQVPVATMRLDVVGNTGGYDQALLQAMGAERMLP
jgi:hypothetical protein